MLVGNDTNIEFARKVMEQLNAMYTVNITEQRTDAGIEVERDENGVDEMMLEYHYANPALPWDEIRECRNNGFDNVVAVAAQVRNLMPGSTPTDAMAFVKDAEKWPDIEDKTNTVRNLRTQVSSLVQALATSTAIMEYQKQQLREMSMAIFASRLKSAFSSGDLGDFKRTFGSNPFDN